MAGRAVKRSARRATPRTARPGAGRRARRTGGTPARGASMHSSSRPSHHAASASRSARSASSAGVSTVARRCRVARGLPVVTQRSRVASGGQRGPACHRHDANAGRRPLRSHGRRELRAEVFEHRPQLVRRAELDERDALVGPAGVAAGPVVDVAGPVDLLGPVGVAHVDRARRPRSPSAGTGTGRRAGPANSGLKSAPGGRSRWRTSWLAPLLAPGLDVAELHLDRDLVRARMHLASSVRVRPDHRLHRGGTVGIGRTHQPAAGLGRADGVFAARGRLEAAGEWGAQPMPARVRGARSDHAPSSAIRAPIDIARLIEPEVEPREPPSSAGGRDRDAAGDR